MEGIQEVVVYGFWIVQGAALVLYGLAWIHDNL